MLGCWKSPKGEAVVVSGGLEGVWNEAKSPNPGDAARDKNMTRKEDIVTVTSACSQQVQELCYQPSDLDN